MKTYEHIVPPKRIVWVPLPEDQKEKPRPSARNDKDMKREMKKRHESSEQFLDLQTAMQNRRENLTVPGQYLMGTNDLVHTSSLLDTPRGNGGMIPPTIESEHKYLTIRPKPKYAWENISPNQEIGEVIPSNPHLLSGNSTKTTPSMHHTKHDDEHSSVIPESIETRYKNMQKAMLDIVPNTNYEWKKTSSKQEFENEVYTPSYTSPIRRSSSSDEKQTEKKTVYTSEELLKFQPSRPRKTAEQSLLSRNSVSELPKTDTGAQSLRSPIDIDISLDLAEVRQAQVAVSRTEREEKRETDQTVDQSSEADRHRNSSLSKCPKG